MTLVGALAGRGRAEVDGRGALRVVGEPWSLDWWIGADDRWRAPATEPAVRQRTIEGTPVVETAMRVPGGDAIERVYGVGGPGGLVIVEVENDSPAAFVVAFAVSGARTVASSGPVIEVDGLRALFLAAPPARWKVGTTALDPATVAFETGPFPSVTAGRKEHVTAAVLAPLSHRNRLRVAMATSGEDPGPVELGAAASATEAATGWHTLLDHGMRVVLPDPGRQSAVELARSQVLLDPDPDGAATAALEDWGHDTEAAWAWRGLSFGGRRAARGRAGPFDDATPAGLLMSVRRALVRDERGLALAPALPDAWRGQDLEVFDAPTRHGRLSYAVRYHGDRVALLWEVAEPTDDLVLRAPAFDPRWSSREPTGEALLGPVPTP